MCTNFRGFDFCWDACPCMHKNQSPMKIFAFTEHFHKVLLTMKWMGKIVWGKKEWGAACLGHEWWWLKFSAGIFWNWINVLMPYKYSSNTRSEQRSVQKWTVIFGFPILPGDWNIFQALRKTTTLPAMSIRWVTTPKCEVNQCHWALQWLSMSTM